MTDASEDTKDLVRRQFGANAANYATSAVHAKGASLDRLVELMAPDPTWALLDIATAAGHTAFAFSPHVATVVASDLVDEMLDVARAQADERGCDNVSFERADAENLPFDDCSFDAVTCRIAPHHFNDPGRFVGEVARVLRPGGLFGLVDNMVDDEAEHFVNDWERKRDPSHVKALSVERWTAMIEQAGLAVVAAETLAKRMRFQDWVENMSVPADVRVELLAELKDAPEAAATYLRPEFGASGNQSSTAFHLTEGVLVARKPTR